MNTKIFAFVDVPVLLWSPGCKFLGVDYAAAVAETFDYTSFRLQTGQNGINPSGPNAEYGSSQYVEGDKATMYITGFFCGVIDALVKA